MVEVHMLPAQEGDFFWIRYGQEKFSNIIVDGGTETTGVLFWKVLNEIYDRNEKIEALILTHIDNDHIEGALEAIAHSDKKILQSVIKSIWFNTCKGIRAQCGNDVVNTTDAEDNIMCTIPSKALGVSQANTFLEMLEKQGLNSRLRQYICAGTEYSLGKAKIRVISPGEKELLNLANNWESCEKREEQKALSANYVPIHQKDLDALKVERLGSDSSVNNRSSIAFLFEYENTCLAFLGDAAARVCLDGLKKIGITKPYPVDLLKLSHHGSKYNISDRLLKMLPTRNYLLSTNGQTLTHNRTVPSKTTIAHLLKDGILPEEPIQLFSNYSWWADAYNNKFFTQKDKRQYIDTGRLKLIVLDETEVKIKNGLEVYG